MFLKLPLLHKFTGGDLDLRVDGVFSERERLSDRTRIACIAFNRVDFFER